MTKFIAAILPARERGLAQKFPQYNIGRGTYGDLTVRTWHEGATLEIGAFCSIAAGVKIFLGGEHRPDWVTTYPFSVLWEGARYIKGHPKTKGDVVIGNDVWIGTDALISSGVRVGDGAVIGAGAVVTKEVPAYAVVAGNPARVVRYRFTEETIQRLLKVQWWEWDDTKIQRAMPDLLNVDIEAFLVKAERSVY